MSYDPDSAEAKKGALGEEIARKCLEGLGATITRPDEFGAKGLVDFLAVPKAGSSFAARYVEVKVRRSAFPYAHGQYPCYAFRVVQSKEFPFDQETKLGFMRFYHQKQFDTARDMSKADIERLRAFEPNKLTISDAEAAALWHSIDYGTGLGVEWLTREALVALKELTNEFSSTEVLRTIAKFCAEHYYDFCGAVQGMTGCPLEDVIKALRETLTAEQSFADKNSFVKADDILTAPNGTNIDVLTVAGDSRFFVKASRVSSAIGYQNPLITASSAIIKAADRLQVEYYRFPNQRLSSGSCGSKAYYFAVEDVPKVLAQYCELHYKAKPATRQGQYNQAAQKLCEWFKSTVLPKYSSASQKVTIIAERTAIMLPFGLRAPNGQGFSLLVRKSGAFLYLPQPEDLGVNPSFIRRRYTFDHYEGEFAHYMDLSNAIFNSDEEELYHWWLNEGLPAVEKANKDFSVAHSVILKHLGFDLPDEWSKLEQQLDTLIGCRAIKGQESLPHESTERLRKNVTSRPKKTVTVIAVDNNLAKKLDEVQTPNGTLLEFFAVEGLRHPSSQRR